MTALDVFRRCAAADEEIERIRERIERREALATGATARPLSPDGGGHGSGDASMRLLDYVGDVEQLREKLAKRTRQRDMDRACCVYLAEVMPAELGRVMLRLYMDGMRLDAIGAQEHCSLSTVKRLKRRAEALSARIDITWWDGVHVPITAVRDA